MNLHLEEWLKKLESILIVSKWSIFENMFHGFIRIKKELLRKQLSLFQEQLHEHNFLNLWNDAIAKRGGA